MLHTRDAAWIALFGIFQEIHPKKLIPTANWQALSFLMEALSEDEHLDDWAKVISMFDAIDGNRRISTKEEWHRLYDALDKLWADEPWHLQRQRNGEAHSAGALEFSEQIEQ
jgi:hypothetical protein